MAPSASVSAFESRREKKNQIAESKRNDDSAGTTRDGDAPPLAAALPEARRARAPVTGSMFSFSSSRARNPSQDLSFVGASAGGLFGDPARVAAASSSRAPPRVFVRATTTPAASAICSAAACAGEVAFRSLPPATAGV